MIHVISMVVWLKSESLITRDESDQRQQKYSVKPSFCQTMGKNKAFGDKNVFSHTEQSLSGFWISCRWQAVLLLLEKISHDVNLLSNTEG